MENLDIGGLYEEHQLQHQQIPPGVNIIDTGADYSTQLPHWSSQETRDFLMIRAELDQSFMETRRNKLLWEVTSAKMKDKGYNRTAEQCKSKWKILCARYKGAETKQTQAKLKQHFTNYHEIHAIFTARMQRKLLQEAELGGGQAGGSENKLVVAQRSSDNEDDAMASSKKKKRRTNKNSQAGSRNAPSSGKVNKNVVINNMKEMLEDFMEKQTEIGMRWLKAYETREEERKKFKMEWRQKMEALEIEMVTKDMMCREKEEQRRVREEARAERRDALITQLLNKLRRE